MIYLVRHGQTDWNLECRAQGHTDVPLNETGEKQAFLASKILKDYQIDKIFSSDLSRAYKTASIINQKFNVDIKKDQRLREIRYGDIEGVKRDLLPDNIWHLYINDSKQFNGESYESVYNRVKEFFEELNKEENILIVTHGGTLRLIMFYINHKNGFDGKVYEEFIKDVKIKNADIFKLDLEKNEIESIKND